MEIKLEHKGHYKYLTILKVLAGITDPKINPFHKLRNRELELFSIFLYFYNEKYASIPVPEREQIIFSYNTRAEFSKLLGDVTLEVVYNLMAQLRKRGLITKDSINKSCIIPDLTKLSLKFV